MDFFSTYIVAALLVAHLLALISPSPYFVLLQVMLFEGTLEAVCLFILVLRIPRISYTPC